jgi:hypothetical protein
MRNKIGSLLSMAMMFEGMNSALYNTGSNGSRYYEPTKNDLDKSKGILVHNTLNMHTFTVHGVEIQAPNLKAAKKIYNRTKHKINA